MQALLLWGQLVLVAWNAMHLFWSPATGDAAKAHLRMWVALRALSFALSALQLRHGYPPQASYTYVQPICVCCFKHNLLRNHFLIFACIRASGVSIVCQVAISNACSP